MNWLIYVMYGFLIIFVLLMFYYRKKADKLNFYRYTIFFENESKKFITIDHPIEDNFELSNKLKEEIDNRKVATSTNPNMDGNEDV